MKNMIQLLLWVFTVLSCSKKTEIIYLAAIATETTATGKQLICDTTITGTWDGGGKTFRPNDYQVHGTGTFQNWVIDAGRTQKVFDTSITLKNIKTYGEVFSTAWYGANPGNADNWWNIQKSINTCIDNNLPCFTPSGQYKYSHTLFLGKIVNNAYAYTKLHFFGTNSFWDNGTGTQFFNTSTVESGMNIQLGKGSEVDHIGLYGLFKSPTGFEIPYDQFSDVNGKCGEDYFGLVIDQNPPINGITNSGSTGIHLHDISIGNYTYALMLSPNAITLNNDILRVENFHGGDCKAMIVGCEAQQKGMVFDGVYCWGQTHTVISIGKYGRKQAGDFKFLNGNIAGQVIRLFDINAANWYSTKIEGFYCENLYTIGDISTAVPIMITNSTFHINLGFDKTRALINANSNNAIMDNLTIEYYDGGLHDVYVHGRMTWTGINYFGGGNLLNK